MTRVSEIELIFLISEEEISKKKDHQSNLFKNTYFFVCASSIRRVGSSSLDQKWNLGPCIGSGVLATGSPEKSHEPNFKWVNGPVTEKETQMVLTIWSVISATSIKKSVNSAMKKW